MVAPVQSGLDKYRQEGPVKEVAIGQPKGDVTHRCKRLYLKLLFCSSDRLKHRGSLFLAAPDGHADHIHIEAIMGNTHRIALL